MLDAGLTGALVLYGATPGHAAAAVLVYHAMALWVPGLGGLLAYARLRSRLLSADVPRPAARLKRRSDMRPLQHRDTAVVGFGVRRTVSPFREPAIGGAGAASR